MAKFCGNCGTELDDNAKVCGNCGTPLDDGVSNISGIEYKHTDPEKKKKIKKVIKRILTAIISAVVIAVVCISVLSFTGYKGMIRKVMKAYKNYDIDALVDMSSDMYFYREEDYVEEYFEYSVGSDLDFYEDSVGHSYKLSYEIKEIYTLSDRKFSEMIDTIAGFYSDFDADIIQKIVVADITVTAKQGSKSVDNDVQITLSKEGNSWKVLYID